MEKALRRLPRTLQTLANNHHLPPQPTSSTLSDYSRIHGACCLPLLWSHHRTCVVCRSLLIGWSSSKAKCLLFSSIYAHTSHNTKHIEVLNKWCQVEISSWLSCSIQSVPTLVEVRRGGDWEEQSASSFINYLSLPEPLKTQAKQRPVQRVGWQQKNHEFHSSGLLFFPISSSANEGTDWPFIVWVTGTRWEGRLCYTFLERILKGSWQTFPEIIRLKNYPGAEECTKWSVRISQRLHTLCLGKYGS